MDAQKVGGVSNHTSHAPKDALWGLEWPFKGYVFVRPFRPVDNHGSRADPVLQYSKAYDSLVLGGRS